MLFRAPRIGSLPCHLKPLRKLFLLSEWIISIILAGKILEKGKPWALVAV